MTPKQQTRARALRTEAYAKRISRAFDETAERIVKLRTDYERLPEGEMYSFDIGGRHYKEELEKELRRLASTLVLINKNGMKEEWERANKEVNDLLESKLGKDFAGTKEFRNFFEHNKEAMNSFINRTENGMNLSKRVWRDVAQYRDEMEAAITLGIGEGKSADKLSREVMQYLNRPDDIFRRFRYLKETPIYDEEGNQIDTRKEWCRKWKKKVRGEDGKVHWEDFDYENYHTGKGVYRSAKKNAMRVTRTETNMAYGQAQYERWNAPDTDYILGITIGLSGSHPKEDICDELAGDYPKDFKFIGWHPQCFCYAVPILPSEEEQMEAMRAAMRGEDYEFRGRVTDVPEGFRRWIGDNREKLRAGKVPYFVRENMDIVDKIYYIEECRDKFNAYDEKGMEQSILRRENRRI